MSDKPGRVVIAALIVLAAQFSANARAAGSGVDSLCLHFAANAREVHLSLGGALSMNGVLPLTLCDLRRDERYDLVIRGRGWELRRGYLDIGKNGVPKVAGNRAGTFLANAVVPGYGSIRAKRTGEGWTDLLSLGVTGLVFNREHREWKHLKNRHAVLMDQLDDAEDEREAQSIRLEAYRAARDVNVQNKYQQRLAVYAAYVYGFQLIDPWLAGNPPRYRVEAEGTVVRISASRSRGAKASALSFLRPGRGQFYQGKNNRGIFFSLTTTAAGLVALDYHNKYDEAVNEYEINLERYLAAGSASERQALSGREPVLWDAVEESKLERNIAYGVLIGVWAAGVIDTFFPGGEDAPPSDLTLDIGPSHAFIVYRF